MPNQLALRAGTLIGLLLTAIALVGCGLRPAAAPDVAITAGPAPTVAPIFSAQRPTLPSLPARTTMGGSVVPEPRQAGPLPLAAGVASLPIYDDRLDANWSLEHSFMMDYELQQTRFVDAGRFALEARPTMGTGVLYFTVRPEARRIYRRDKVLGVHFRLSGGGGYIDNDDMVVTIVGSNSQPYWVPDDRSVQIDGRVTGDEELIFSETRLYYLNINQAIPPETWVDVVNWLEDREFDPDYRYVTGIYIKTNQDVLERFFIDEVSLLIDTSGE